MLQRRSDGHLGFHQDARHQSALPEPLAPLALLARVGGGLAGGASVALAFGCAGRCARAGRDALAASSRSRAAQLKSTSSNESAECCLPVRLEVQSTVFGSSPWAMACSSAQSVAQLSSLSASTPRPCRVCGKRWSPRRTPAARTWVCVDHRLHRELLLQ